MMILPRLNKATLIALAAVVFVTLSLGASAQTQQVLVPSSVSPFNATTGYTYSYSVTNSTTMDLAVITIPCNSRSALLNLTAPAGFLITFDSGNGLASFLEDNNQSTPQTFAPNSTITGFSFTSFYTPGTVTFDSFNAGGNEFMGTTQAPTAVPEPNSTVLSLVGLALIGGVLVRQRHLSSRSVLVQ